MNWIFQVLILLGEGSLWSFEKLMTHSRDRLRTWLLLTFPSITHLLVIPFLSLIIPKELLSTFNNVLFTGLTLWIINEIYHSVTGKKWFELISKKTNSEPNEGLIELKEKQELFIDLFNTVSEFQFRRENVPPSLLHSLYSADNDRRRLLNNLYVASEFFGDYTTSRNTGFIPTAEIKEIPIEKYSASLSTEMNEPGMCSICIKDFQQDEELRRLPCGHRFHFQCVDFWETVLAVCPNCKVKLERNQDAA